MQSPNSSPAGARADFHAEDERQWSLYVLERLDRVNRAMQGSLDLEQMLVRVLDTVLEIYGCDRAWLAYPCDPDASTWSPVMERTRPEHPPAVETGSRLPMTPQVASAFRALLGADGPLCFGGQADLSVHPDDVERYGFRAQMAMAVHPAVDRPYVFGIHQCSYERHWGLAEQRLFLEIGRRLSDGLSSVLVLRRLRESEARLAEAQRIAHVGYWTREGADGPMMWSDELCRICGVEPETFVPTQETLMALVHPDDRDMVASAIERATAVETRRVIEHRVVRPDGDERFVSSETAIVRGPDGSVVRMFGVVQDITERRRAENDLRAGEARYRALVDNAIDAIFVQDRAGVILDVNRQACESLGRTREELIGTTASAFEPDLERLDLATFASRLGEGGLTFDSRHQRSDGTTFPVEVRIRPYVEHGRPLAVSIARDLTERVRMEEQLRQAQKMEAVGRLAGGVAHDFNNLLTVINGYSEVIAASLTPDDPRCELVAEIQRSGERAARLTRQLLAFSRKQVLQPRMLSLNARIDDLHRLLRRLIGEDVEMALELEPALWLARVDPAQFEQAIINLVVNARDAMPEGGRLTIVTANVTLSESPRLDPDVRPGRYVMVAVRDTGLGMDGRTRQQIFDPFFTTKEPGRGTGLGLAMVYGFLKQSGGHVDVESEPGHGATFRLYLPAADAHTETAVATGAGAALPVGTETVLLVEDEGAVRRFSRRTLETQGYTVLEADDGENALAVVARHPEPIDLLVSDVIMPRMSGPQLAAALTARLPQLAVLFVSGYSEEARARLAIEDAPHAFLQKPFSAVDLTRMVRTVLDRASR